ncbi:hypothetical protein MTR67_018186 [Solanum verrucosum]|uniref:Uncharacterized protein n=1 Tax=Solanum verrucosum TaxID=315347 RepID=A0AAF0TM61_SOLVR|nr:hypothetical protein MTR67_018186 [Solanum verrucosum]
MSSTQASFLLDHEVNKIWSYSCLPLFDRRRTIARACEEDEGAEEWSFQFLEFLSVLFGSRNGPALFCFVLFCYFSFINKMPSWPIG